MRVEPLEGLEYCVRKYHIDSDFSRGNSPSDIQSEYSQINRRRARPVPGPTPVASGDRIARAMSTRRTTRAASRQASSRGASPAPSTVVASGATPRRNTRRAGNEPLPAVGLRQSTAYGDNTTAKPARVTGPVVSEQINDILRDLMTPEPAPINKPARGSSRSQTPAAATGASDKSFNIESGLFYGAQVESSPQSDPSLHLPGIEERSDEESPEPPTAPIGRIATNAEAERKTLEELARQRLEVAGHPVQRPLFPGRVFTQARHAPNHAWSSVKYSAAFTWSFLKSIFSLELLPILTLALVALILYSIFSGEVRSYGSGWSHNIGQFIPYRLTHPLDFFQSDEVRVINRRLNELEYQVARIKSHTSELDSKAIARLEEILPELLVVKKDKYGNSVIPDDFWHALQDKIRSDDTLISDQIDQTTQTGKNAVSGKALTKEIERVTRNAWDRYVKQNHNNMKGILADELGQKFPRLLEEHHVATKAEIVELIRQNWDQKSDNLRSEIAQITKKFEAASRQIAKLQHSSGSISKDEIRTISTEALRKIIPHAQLEALAKSNLLSAVDYSLSRPNHFAKSTGATVNLQVTSPNYVFPGQDVWFPTRWAHALIGNPIPIPQPPGAALERWEEHGDCWCSPSRDTEGFGPSIGVIIKNRIYPDQVVIEHIPSSATLEPGAAPRDMELLAYMDDIDAYNAVKTASEELFPEEEGETQHPFRYVRIATWTFDIEAHHVQAFLVQVDMRSLGAETNKLIVRSKNNWGGEEVPYTCLYRVRVHGPVAPVSEPQ